MSKITLKPSFYAISLLSIFGACAYYVLQRKGISQIGNVLSFVGTLTLLTPPFRQLLGNLWFSKASEGPPDDEFASLQDEAELTRVREYVSFSRADLRFFVVGIMMTGAGFFLNILYSPDLIK